MLATLESSTSDLETVDLTESEMLKAYGFGTVTRRTTRLRRWIFDSVLFRVDLVRKNEELGFMFGNWK